MSDFLISFGKQYRGEELSALITEPYGNRRPKGRYFDFPWGSMAILEEHLADNNNILERDGVVFAWVGDLVTEMSEGFVDALISRIGQIRNPRPNETLSLESDEVFEKLDGAFALLIADYTTCSVVTDPLGFTQVYAEIEGDNNLVSIGTHPDLVAAVSDKPLDIDIISVGEFLNSGTPTAPNTIYKNVKELKPGRLHQISINGDRVEIKDFVYWSPPKEMKRDYNEDELAKELEKVLIKAVRRRCKVQKAAVLLSGGFDSRVLIAAVPRSVDCIALTFCNYPNRETRIASKVAKCYGRWWFPLVREQEFLGKTVIERIKLIGCEFDWVNTLVIGLIDQIKDHSVCAVLHGAQFDVYLKGYFADDWRCKKSFGGALPSKYVKNNAYDYINNVSAFWKENLVPGTVGEMHLRRRRFFEENADCGRGSIAEWMIVYPFSNDGSVAFWPAERRVLPIKFVATDRGLLDFTFRCPFKLKLERTVFDRVVREICSLSVSIPSANDGVRPGSGHWSRLAQRAVRKLQDRTTSILEKLGKEPKIQHSWYDYQKYWRESKKLDELRQQYGANLDQFDGILFKESGRELLYNKDIDWHYGFRLLQLAVWLGIIKEYRDVLKVRAR